MNQKKTFFFFFRYVIFTYITIPDTQYPNTQYLIPNTYIYIYIHIYNAHGAVRPVGGADFVAPKQSDKLRFRNGDLACMPCTFFGVV